MLVGYHNSKCTECGMYHVAIISTGSSKVRPIRVAARRQGELMVHIANDFSAVDAEWLKTVRIRHSRFLVVTSVKRKCQ